MSVKQVWRQIHDSTEIVLDAARKCLKLRAKQTPRGAFSHRSLYRDPPGVTRPRTPLLFSTSRKACVAAPFPKKSKNLHKHSCGFFPIRIDHGHRRGGLNRLRDARAISSVGRAPRLHRGCREFESLIAHHSLISHLILHRFLPRLSHFAFCPSKVRHFASPKPSHGA